MLEYLVREYSWADTYNRAAREKRKLDALISDELNAMAKAGWRVLSFTPAHDGDDSYTVAYEREVKATVPDKPVASHDLQASLDAVSKEVESWPDWKRSIPLNEKLRQG